MIAPDHATKRFETILRERGHPYIASGRDGSSDRRQAILALASGRRRRRGSRPARAAATRQDRSRETDAQGAQETRLRARCAGDRQAALLRRGKVRNRIVGAPRPGLTREQPGREFASTDTTARAQGAAFQIARISSTLL